MLRKLFTLFAALTLATASGAALAADWSDRPNTQHTQSIIEIKAASAATSWTEIESRNFIGGAIYQWEIICTDDDAVDFSLATLAPDGTNYIPIGSVTTTDANDDDNDGETGLYSSFYVVSDQLYYKLENISSGTCSIRLIKWDK